MLYQIRSVFFKILCVMVLPVVLASCSFKKEPESKKQKLVFVQQSLPEAPERSLEAIVAEDADADIIESLPGFKTQIAQMRSGPVSILDLAIKHKKYDLLAYLIVTGESPFSLNEDSYRLMEYDGNLDKLISSAQRDQFMNLVRAYPRPQTTHFYHYPERPSMSLFYSRLNEMPLGARGCEQLIDFVFDFTYAGEKSVLPGVYHEAIFDVPGKNLVKDLMGDPICRSYAGNLNTKLVSKWITKEFLAQFKDDFKDVDYLRFLTSLNKAAYFDYSLPKTAVLNSADAYLNNVIVDPAFLVLLKGGCVASEEVMKSWIKFAETFTMPHSSNRRFTYNSNNFEPVCGATKADSSYCRFGLFDTQELDLVASFFFPKLYSLGSSFLAFDNRYSWDLLSYLNEDIKTARYKVFSQVCKANPEQDSQ